VCLTTRTQLLPKPFRHILRSSAVSLSFQYPFFSSRSSSSCLHLFTRLPVTSIFSLYPSLNKASMTVVPTQDVTNPVNLPSFYCLYVIPLLLDSLNYFFSHAICHFSPLRLKTSHVFLIYFPETKFQHYTKLCSKCGILLDSSLNLSPICW